jgi:hypothetical protein
VTGLRDEHVVPGALWRSKRDRGRTVVLGERFDSYKGESVQIRRRNTSGRRQAMRVVTLLRDYEYSHMAGGV